MPDTRAAALAEGRRLRAIMLDYGVPEVSIEVRPGRPTGYGSWLALYPVAEMSHHTVSRYSPSNLTPVLSLCKNGRSDLPGPLCNGYGGWDLTYRIITFGYANHPGQGGPHHIPTRSGSGYVIPRDSARRYVWGTEYEGGLNAGDWDRELRNPRTGHRMTFREFMGRCNAALVEYLEIVPEAHLEHSTWANGRKIDRLGYSREEGIAEVRRYQDVIISPPDTQPPEDDMSWDHPIPILKTDKTEPADRAMARNTLNSVDARKTAQAAVRGIEVLAEKLDALAPGIDRAVREAVRDALAEQDRLDAEAVAEQLDVVAKDGEQS